MGIVEESDPEEDEDTAGLQKNYNSLLEKSGKICKGGQGSCEKDEES